jgi:putative phosphoesterase
MKIGIISDLHNNSLALEIVLNEFETQGIDGIICCGDIIGIGPSPEEVVTRLRNMKNLIACIKGNHESYLINGMENSKMDEHERKYHEWEHSFLTDKSVHFLSSLPMKKVLRISGKTISVIHYAYRGNQYKGVHRNPSSDDLDELFCEVDSDIIIYGHDHSPSHIEGNKVYINPGALGCPGKDKNIARAGVLDINETVTYQQLNLEYNVQDVINIIEELNYPAKDIIKEVFFGV